MASGLPGNAVRFELRVSKPNTRQVGVLSQWSQCKDGSSVSEQNSGQKSAAHLYAFHHSRQKDPTGDLFEWSCLRPSQTHRALSLLLRPRSHCTRHALRPHCVAHTVAQGRTWGRNAASVPFVQDATRDALSVKQALRRSAVSPSLTRRHRTRGE